MFLLLQFSMCVSGNPWSWRSGSNLGQVFHNLFLHLGVLGSICILFVVV